MLARVAFLDLELCTAAGALLSSGKLPGEPVKSHGLPECRLARPLSTALLFQHPRWEIIFRKSLIIAVAADFDLLFQNHDWETRRAR
jgi:hypothetical protein